MRLSPHALRRRWILTAAAVLVAIPFGAPAAVAAPAKLPHPVGGYAPGKVRTAARALHATDVPPASVDLREFAPTPGDQGQIGACVAWTIAYSVMGYYAKRTGGSGAPYAPLFLYMRNVAPGKAPSAGLVPDYVLANAVTAGVDTQADYWQGTTNYQSAPTAAEIANALNYRVAGWTRLFNGANQGAAAQTVVMQALASGSPVALGIPVYNDFMYLGKHSLYSTVSGTSLGGHMLTAYGYDAQGVWIRNSWGTSWGNGGDAKLSWAFIKTAASGAYTISGIKTSAPVAVAPTVTALSSVTGSAGASVTITGTGMAGATGVKFGDTTATFTPQTTSGVTKLVATAPAHARGVVDVTVTNASGTSAVSAGSKFTYVPPPPAVSALSPASVSTLGGAVVTLSGTELTGVTSVKLGATPVPATEVTTATLSFVAPAHDAGTVAVTVTNTNGTSTQTVQLTYVKPPAPTVKSVTPSSGPTNKATPVVLTGTELAGATKVTAGGVSVPFVKVSATQLSVTLPVHVAGAVALQVTGSGGVSELDSAARYTYLAPAPAVTTVAPSTGLSTKSTTVLLSGTAFAGATKVTASGVSVPFVQLNETKIQVVLPPRAAGKVELAVTTPAGTSAAASFTYVK